MMLSKTKSGKSLLPSKDPSLKQLAALNKLLDQQQKQTTRVVKEINNEAEHGKKQQGKIDRSFQKINEDGSQLVRRHEEEKEKHDKLQTLVKQMEEQLYQAKVERMEELKTKGEVDKLEELKTELAGREKELQKIIEKTNTSTYESVKKVDAIRALRSQRTIVSALLDKIERELCSLEHCYKVLVIERNVGQQQYHLTLEEFRECEATAEQQIEKMIRNKQRNTPVESQDSARPSEPRNTESMNLDFRRTSVQGDVPTSLLREPNTDKRDRSRERTARTLRTLRDAFDEKYEKELESIMQEKRVKEVFHDMGINSCSELPESLEQQQLINDELYSANMRMEEQIENLRSELEGLSLKKKSKKEVDPLTALCHKRKSQVQRFNTDLKQTKVELNEFNRILKVIYENQVSASASEQDSMEAFFNEEEETNFYMASLQTFLEQSMRPATHRLAESRATVQEVKQECKEGRLTELLSNSRQHKNSMAIYDQEDLVNFARRNLGAAQVPVSRFASEG